jgi:hypothetical protein
MNADSSASQLPDEAWIAKFRAALADAPEEKTPKSKIRQLIVGIYRYVDALVNKSRYGGSRSADRGDSATQVPAPSEHTSVHSAQQPSKSADAELSVVPVSEIDSLQLLRVK